MENNICDNCGKNGRIAPQVKVRTAIADLEVSLPDPENPGERVVHKVQYEKPVMKKVKGRIFSPKKWWKLKNLSTKTYKTESFVLN